MPQAFTSIDNFSLEGVWGFLDVAKEEWEEQLSLHHSVVEFMMEIQEQIEHIQPIAQEHMCFAVKQ